MSKQPPPAPIANATGPPAPTASATTYPNCRTPRHWKFAQDHRTTRPSPIILKVINPFLKGHMINRILHSWSFHRNFMKPQKK